jgi:hypothetical protein
MRWATTGSSASKCSSIRRPFTASGDHEDPALLAHRVRDLRHANGVDPRPEVTEDPTRLPHRTFDLGIDVVEEHRLAERDAESTHPVLQRVEHVMRRHMHGGLVVEVDALQGLVHERGVLHGARERSDAVERPRERIDAGSTDTPHRRLQAYRAAEGGRDPDRATRVGSQRGRHDACPHGDARATARPPGRVRRRMPGIVGSAVIVVDPDAAERELHRVRLADEHHAGRRQSTNGGAIPRRDAVREQSRARGRRHPGHVVQILCGVRDAVERPEVVAAPQQRLRRSSLRERAVRRHPDERVQTLVERRDASERRLGQLDRADGAAAKLCRQFADGCEVESRVSHLRPPERNGTTRDILPRSASQEMRAFTPRKNVNHTDGASASCPVHANAPFS